MTVTTKIAADTKEGLTLLELGRFVDECRRQGYDPAATRIRFHTQTRVIRGLGVEARGPIPPPAPVREYDHKARPDDDPEPGDRCKDCGGNITWMGPSVYDWLHADDQNADRSAAPRRN